MVCCVIQEPRRYFYFHDELARVKVRQMEDRNEEAIFDGLRFNYGLYRSSKGSLIHVASEQAHFYDGHATLSFL